MSQTVQDSRVDLYKKQIERNDLKQHADKIIQGIKKLGSSHAKRAIWELFQNAVDLSFHCEISISVSEDELIFSHNGVPFTMHTLDCLFTQVSSKTPTEKKIEREDLDPIGQYGTGFMTSHSFGDVVKVSGAIKDSFGNEENQTLNDDNGHIKFNDLIIDRSEQDWEKLCDQIRDLRKEVTQLLSKPLTYGELPSTIFKFGFNHKLNKERAFDALESLKIILPYVMIFNSKLKNVSVTDIDGNTTYYQKEDNEVPTGQHYSQVIKINDDPKQINYLKTDKLIIVLPFNNILGNDDYIGKANQLHKTLPRLFLFYPLIGTENFGFNFVIHSKNFQPTEPRNGLYLNSDNEKNKIEEENNQNLLEDASNAIFSFLENNLSRIQNPHLFAEINFLLQSEDEKINSYFLSLKERWTAKFKVLPLIETNTDRISAQESIFLDSTVIENTDPKTLEAIYKIVGQFYHNLPKPELIPIWTKLTDEWSVPDTTKIRFSDIAEKIQENGQIAPFDKSDLILLYKEMIRKGEGELFANKALIPNIKGQLKKQTELSRSVNLTEELLIIADTINPKISNRQIDKEFLFEGLDFEPFDRKNYMELINISLDEHIIDGVRSHNLPPDYLVSLLKYASIVPKEDSITGPLRVIKLIAEHYNLPFNPTILPTLQSEDNIDVRKGQFDFFKIYLGDISDMGKDWVEDNIESLTKVLKEAFQYADIKKNFLRYDVYPNQHFELRPINSLDKDNKIPNFIKDLYDEVIDPAESVRSRLAYHGIDSIYEEMKSINGLDLTRQIEHRFFGDSGSDIYMENHPFRSHIIDIIRSFKENQQYSDIYEKLFPATFRNKSAILVQLADGEASFTILSQDLSIIKKLAGIANHPNIDELLRLGEDALRKKQQDEFEMQFKKKIGNHLEDVLRQYLSGNIQATVKSEQDGQDLIIYIGNTAVYYIEVKSKWLETTPIRISRNQTLRSYQNPTCFALCSIDMTKYSGIDKYAIESIDTIVQFMKFNMDIGKRVEHLISVYENAHQHDKFSLDGDYRTLIPSAYIKEGLNLKDFETNLIKHLNNNYDPVL